MGNSGKWFRIFFTRKRDKVKQQFSGNQNSSPSYPEIPTTPISIPPTPPKRWSFRRSSATAPTSKDLCSIEPIVSVTTLDKVDEQKKHAMEIAAATAAAADATMAAAEAAAAVIGLTASANQRAFAIEEAAATKIQSTFRSYLARKALCALRGLVKLQALVRGHLVRKQATATLHCMQALITAQARARALRIQTLDEAKLENHRPSSAYRRSTRDRVMHTYNDMDMGLDENIKIVEIDSGSKNRNNYSNQDYQVSPSPSRTLSGHFEDYGFSTAQSSPQRYSVVSKLDSAGLPFDFHPPECAEPLSYDYSLYPNYMANTQSSRAKARSQSAPKQRPADPFERQASRRRPSMEGRNVPRAVRMQRSSSHLGAAAQNYQYPWSMKLDRSTVSLIESECGSTSTVLTNNYCRSVVTFDASIQEHITGPRI